MSVTHSPFPPIADYGFLSDCHTGALVAPDGSVDWLCLPAFDSASVFGNILDRGAGSFRFGPYGINVPTARTYVPGTNVLMTTWHTPGGWIVVHDALVMGPRRGADTVTPHTRPPADDDALHLLVRTVECLEGTVEVELVCEPAFDYGRGEATWTLQDAEGHRADAADAAGPAFRLSTDMLIGIEGGTARARHVLTKGDRAFCALSWAEGLAGPSDVAEADRAHRRHHPLLAQLAGARPDPRPQPAAPARAVGAHHQGPHLHADRGDRGGADDLAARDARRGAQLGLPLHVDARHDVHPPGAALPEPRLGGRRVHAVRRRPRAEPGRRAADHVRHRRPARPHRVHARRAVGLRGRATRADSGTAPSTSARTTSSVPSSTRCSCTPGAASTCRDGCGRSCSRRRRERSPPGGSPTRASGRRAGSRSTTCRRS